MGRKRGAVIFADATNQAYVKAAHKHPLSRQFDSRRRLKIVDQDEVGSRLMPGVSFMFRFARAWDV